MLVASRIEPGKAFDCGVFCQQGEVIRNIDPIDLGAIRIISIGRLGF
jgi:hypothetical protein